MIPVARPEICESWEEALLKLDTEVAKLELTVLSCAATVEKLMFPMLNDATVWSILLWAAVNELLVCVLEVTDEFTYDEI